MRSTSAAAPTTALVSVYLPHGGYASDVFADYMASMRTAAFTRAFWACDLSINFDSMGSGSEDTDARMSMVRGFVEASNLQKRDFDNSDEGEKYTPGMERRMETGSGLRLRQGHAHR